MAEKNERQFNNGNPERERFSNFVVDLRSVMRPVSGQSRSGEIKKERKKWRFIRPAEFKNSFVRLKKNQRKNIRNFFKVLKGKLPLFRLSVPKKGKLPLFRLSVPKKRWRKFIKAQERIFSASPRLKREREWADRVSRAEEKISPYRSLFSFIIVLLLIIVPIKLLSYFELLDLKGLEAKVMSRSQLALNNLMAAADSVSKLDFKNADFKFQAAGANFLAAQEDLNKINNSILALAALSNDPKLKLAAESKKFLAAGAIASSLGRNLVLATDSLFNGDKNNFNATLNNFLTYGHSAVNDAQRLKKTVALINPANLPPAYREKFTSLDKQAGFLADNLVSFVATGDKLKEILGLSRDKRYLLIFQNNAELRASGGFLGSYALIDLRDGKIRNLEVPAGGSYDTEAGLKSVRVAAPQPLWLVNPLWHFWDANWWPDWPTTAKNLMWFYEKSDGPSVDGVISVTPTVVERLLEITGPIDLTAEYGLVIDSNNFWDTVQRIVEQKNLEKINPEIVADLPAASSPIVVQVPLKQGLDVNIGNKPKKIIGDLMAKILEILPQKLSKDNLLKIITLFEENISEKQILVYFKDPDLQAEIAGRNLAGEVRETDKDYLLVVNTNIAGQKSDREISEKIEQTSKIASDGTVINTVKITRTHNGVKNKLFTGVRNVDWLRVYVPQGSELLSTDGWQIPEAGYFEEPEASWENSSLLANENAAEIDPATGTKIYSENNKTVFANWVMVDPGQTAVIILKYRLPFNFLAVPADDSWLKRINNWLNLDSAELLSYSLLVQKQPGAKPSEFISRLILPVGFSIFWRHPENLSGMGGWEVSEPLNSDKYWSILVQKNNK